MHLRERFSTTLLQSDTNNFYSHSETVEHTSACSSNVHATKSHAAVSQERNTKVKMDGCATKSVLSTPLQYLKGVGPQTARLFASKGLLTVADALTFFPRDYQDRSVLSSINQAQPGQTVLVYGQIIDYSFSFIRSKKRPVLEAVLRDTTGILLLKWFHYNKNVFEAYFRKRPFVLAYGPISIFGKKKTLIHPEIEWNIEPKDLLSAQTIVPVYSETEGLYQKTIRKIIAQAVQMGLSQVKEDLPSPVLKKHDLLPIQKTIEILHKPPKDTSLMVLQNFQTPAQRRLVFEDFFKFEWIVGKKRLENRRQLAKAYWFKNSRPLFDAFFKNISFELTEDQKDAVRKIYKHLQSTHPMNVLLQGDVGCGKTLVAFFATLPVIAAGGQTVFMVPTEILAEQHYLSAKKFFRELPSPIQIEVLTSSTPASKRKEVLKHLSAGQIHILIGTHAVLSESVRFLELGLVITDEQHRFGVDQRLQLRTKGLYPHVLSMTATPIPRTLALTAYGDLDVVQILQTPKGRAQVATSVLSVKERKRALSKLVGELSQGRQGYVIYPLIQESEKVDLENAIEGFEYLSQGPLKNFSVGLLHGRLKPYEKSSVMENFKTGKIQVLVSTTVVEVGVDIPNATTLIVENAERFGLSQLHQLRGRVGRGIHPSYCFLIAASLGLTAQERLYALERTQDGFKLAELDLKIRGPGEFLGTRQSGELQFKYANLARDQRILEQARRAAQEILEEDPLLVKPENNCLRRYLENTGKLEQQRFQTA